MPAGYVIGNNDVVEITLESKCLGVTVESVYHYSVHTDIPLVDGNAWLDVVNDAFKLKVVQGPNGLEKNQTTDMLYGAIKCQVVNPVRQYFNIKNVLTTGTLIPLTAPPDTHIELAVRTDASGRGKSGNKKYCGLERVSLAGADWTAGAQANWLLHANMVYLEDLVPDFVQPARFLRPIIWSKRRPADRREVVSVSVRPEVRVLRRRLLGVGI